MRIRTNVNAVLCPYVPWVWQGSLPFLFQERIFVNLQRVIFTVTNIQSVLCIRQRKEGARQVSAAWSASLPLGKLLISSEDSLQNLSAPWALLRKHTEDLPTRLEFSKTFFEMGQTLNFRLCKPYCLCPNYWTLPASSHGQYININQWLWLCPNKTLLRQWHLNFTQFSGVKKGERRSLHLWD